MTDVTLPSEDTGEAEAAPAGLPLFATEAVPESNSPGAVLHRARVAQGYAISDVVHVIRFSGRQIEALERDDYASLPGATAVRGLVRNYAKFLKLDAAPLLQQLEPAVPVPEADVRPPANMGEADEPNIAEHVPPRWIGLVVAALVIGLAGYWYWSLSEPGSLGLRLREGGASSVAAPVAVVTPAVVPLSPPVAAVVAENPPVATGGGTEPPPVAGLRVEFDERSWIEVRDASHKVIFSGEYPAGTRQNIEGKAPYQVWIGKASGVRVFLGERSIDLKPHTREEVARFTLE